METLIADFSALVIGIALAATVQFILGRRGVTQARLKAIGVIEEAEENKRKIVLQAKEEALNIRSTSEKELRDRRSDLNRTERRLNQREEQISQKNESTQKRHRQIRDSAQPVSSCSPLPVAKTPPSSPRLGESRGDGCFDQNRVRSTKLLIKKLFDQNNF